MMSIPSWLALVDLTIAIILARRLAIALFSVLIASMIRCSSGDISLSPGGLANLTGAASLSVIYLQYLSW